jgi:hypothetical protein
MEVIFNYAAQMDERLVLITFQSSKDELGCSPM